MPITWTEQLRTGHPTIDSDHQQLVEIINLVESAVSEGNLVRADQIMFALLAYVTGHFAREEAVQHHIGFPDRDTHKKKHAIMAAFTNHLDTQIRDAADDAGRLACLARLQEALGDWLITHIINEDLKMTPYFSAG